MSYILALATASPPHCYHQESIASCMAKGLNLSSEREKELRKLYRNSAIETRHSVLSDFDLLFKGPSARERNDIYKREAPKLAIQAAQKALTQWGDRPEKITHVITVSCTGMMAPGIEYFLIKELGLLANTKRIGINFMGCFGAFNGLIAAKALAEESPDHRILLVCTELCSLHGQVDQESDSLLANALFADGAAACIVGGGQPKNYLWEIVGQSSRLLENSKHYMAWDVADSGYSMTLSPKVPVLIKKAIAPFMQELLEGKATFEECGWAIHPGGKAILQAIEKECLLRREQTEGSWQVLKDYGNMSSATFLFVLEKWLEKRSKWTLGVAFGPGLCIEGLLLRS